MKVRLQWAETWFLGRMMWIGQLLTTQRNKVIMSASGWFLKIQFLSESYLPCSSEHHRTFLRLLSFQHTDYRLTGKLHSNEKAEVENDVCGLRGTRTLREQITTSPECDHRTGLQAASWPWNTWHGTHTIATERTPTWMHVPSQRWKIVSCCSDCSVTTTH